MESDRMGWEGWLIAVVLIGSAMVLMAVPFVSGVALGYDTSIVPSSTSATMLGSSSPAFDLRQLASGLALGTMMAIVAIQIIRHTDWSP